MQLDPFNDFSYSGCLAQNYYKVSCSYRHNCTDVFIFKNLKIVRNQGLNDKRWIEMGYEYFGKLGPESLNVERLSIMVGLNRSSFYHYFGNVEIYSDYLCDHHIQRFKSIRQQIDSCNNLSPDFFHLVPNFKNELAFHRQLLIHESVARYKVCFDSAKRYTEEKIFQLWSSHNEIHGDPEKEFSLYKVIRDFFLLHFDQSDENEMEKTLNDITVLFHGYESANL